MGGRRLIAAAAVLLAAMPVLARAAEPYRQSILYEWDRLRIDVIVLPPGHGQIYNDAGALPAGASDLNPLDNSYLRAMERGIGLWRAAIVAYGPAWLKNGVTIKTYVAGRDTIPQDVLAQPEIVVSMTETMGPVLGTSYPSKPCPAVVSKAYHVSFTSNDVVTLTAHEVGHCLGLAHVDGPYPAVDVMQAVYQHPDGLGSSPVHCPSTLNVAALERVFARASGVAFGGSTVQLDPSAYRTAC